MLWPLSVVLVANELQNALMNFYCLPQPVTYAIVLRLIFMGCLLAKGAIKRLVPSPVYSVYCCHRQSDCRSVINNEAGSRRPRWSVAAEN